MINEVPQQRHSTSVNAFAAENDAATRSAASGSSWFKEASKVLIQGGSFQHTEHQYVHEVPRQAQDESGMDYISRVCVSQNLCCSFHFCSFYLPTPNFSMSA